MSSNKRYPTKYPNISYTISARTGKKMYFGRYYANKKQNQIKLGTSLTLAR